MVKIALDAGHGPETAGKRSPDGTLREFTFTSSVAEMTRRLLVQEGYGVVLTHDLHRDVPLAERVATATKEHASLFVSIHANAFGAGWNDAAGIETYTFPTAAKETTMLASLIQHSLILGTNQKDRGVKKADFYVLRETRMPAVLIECGFMTNLSEMGLLKKKSYQLQCARAIAFAISGWLYRTGRSG